MMRRFCRYIEKVFDFGGRMAPAERPAPATAHSAGGHLGQCLFSLCPAAAQSECDGGAAAPAPENGTADRAEEAECRPDGAGLELDGSRPVAGDAFGDQSSVGAQQRAEEWLAFSGGGPGRT